MSEPLSTEELLRLEAELAARVRPSPPHPDLPDRPAAGSNVAYLPAAEHDQMMAIARGLGWFARPSEHDHRLALERGRRRQG